MAEFAAIVAELQAAGITGHALVEAIERIEAASIKPETGAAIRMRRYRDRREANGLSRSKPEYIQYIASVRERDGNKCVYCGALENLVTDHILPIIQGGTDDVGNLATACRPCNGAKSGRTLEEWGRSITVVETAQAFTDYMRNRAQQSATVTVCSSATKRNIGATGATPLLSPSSPPPSPPPSLSPTPPITTPPIIPPSSPPRTANAVQCAREADDSEEAFEAWNDLASETGLIKAQILTSPRRSSLKKRLIECGGLAGWLAALDKVRNSRFLNGGSASGWKAGLDFILQPSSFTKLMEGSYDDRKPNGHSSLEEKFRRVAERIDRRQSNDEGGTQDCVLVPFPGKSA